MQGNSITTKQNYENIAQLNSISVEKNVKIWGKFMHVTSSHMAPLKTFSLK